ncbi:MAG: radical SAM protein [Syntrophus sp. RIFOXYC2_FULL_54_9]|nr:MAG: radical SAM protein [Syntrophus sp. RIFOXYC2_FULL_54_9]HBB18285.1 radical SAM protein [Syntrophus sp. (in: bacteria)]
MRVVASTGTDDIARVYIVDFGDGRLVECVESVQPPLPRREKWVLIISTLHGCPVGCLMCDAGHAYQGKLSKAELFAQIDFLVKKRFPDGIIAVDKFKIQFARMGEPALNTEVLAVLAELPGRYRAPGLIASLSTVAPAGTEPFFEKLLAIKNGAYPDGRFQFQFSIHTTDETLRDKLVPVKKWSFAEMASYGERFYRGGDRKITLNFALAAGMPVAPDTLVRHFDPDHFLIKITPLNPTHRAGENGLTSYLDPYLPEDEDALIGSLRGAGYDVLVSIGEVEENRIGSNCGQYVLAHMSSQRPIHGGYSYGIDRHA